MADLFDATYGEPDFLVVNRYSSWFIPDAGIDPTTMSLAYLIGELEIVGAWTGRHWSFVVPSAVAATLDPGEHVVELIVTRIADDETRLLRSFSITVFASNSDRRSHAAIMVCKIESILENRADGDVESYSIKSRSITKMSVKELTDWREFYLAELGREMDVFGGRRKHGNTVKVGFY